VRYRGAAGRSASQLRRALDARPGEERLRIPCRAAVLLVVLAGLAGAAPLRAQTAPPGTGTDPCLPDAAGPPGARMFNKLDPQHTGRVDLAHFVGHRSQRFPSLDADGDGRITRTELGAVHPEKTAASLDETFARFDTDRDGGITRTEWDAAETRRFERIDADHDGFVTRDEFLADRSRVCAARAHPAEAH
jgi:Ca2+-binding EF-hand superfamily protein